MGDTIRGLTIPGLPTIVYFMVNLYGSRWAGHLGNDPRDKQEKEKKDDDASTGEKGAGDAS